MFQPNPHDLLIIDPIAYRIAEHPAAPGMPHGQEGRAGTVYHLLPEGGGEESALKVFKPRFRLPSLVSQAERLTVLADLAGLRACRRQVITSSRNGELLRQHPDLTYAVLMPWIEGPTWMEVLVEKRPLGREQALALGRALAETLVRMEERGLAHCDLSAPNVMLPLLAGGQGVELIDLEGMYAPGLLQPQEVSSGSAGYAHPQAAGGLWGMEADRFAGAVLLGEMLGWCDPAVVQAAWGESYFEPGEMQREGLRYHTLLASLRRHWGEGVAGLFERAWKSETLADCPTFGEWLVSLPEEVSAVAPAPSASSEPPGGYEQSILEIRAFLQAARKMEERSNLEGAEALYQQALELARATPQAAGLVGEIEAMLSQVTQYRAASQPYGLEVAHDKRLTMENGPSGVEGDQPSPAYSETPPPPPPKGQRLSWVLVVLFALSTIILYSLFTQAEQSASTAWDNYSHARATIEALEEEGNPNLSGKWELVLSVTDVVEGVELIEREESCPWRNEISIYLIMNQDFDGEIEGHYWLSKEIEDLENETFPLTGATKGIYFYVESTAPADSDCRGNSTLFGGYFDNGKIYGYKTMNGHSEGRCCTYLGTFVGYRASP